MNRHVVRTACSRDCPDACVMDVTIENGRAVRLQGDKADPVTRGFLCERTRRFLHRQYDDERFVRPMVREKGRLMPVDWDTALDLVADKLTAARRDFGPASILHYRSGGSLGILKHVSELFFAKLGPVTIKRGDICSGAGEAAQALDFGEAQSSALDDLLHSKLIIIWGKNPHTSGVHLLPVLQEAKSKGAILVGIDPVRTRLEGLCDVFLSPRPGADHALALGMVRWMFENDQIAPDVSSYCDHVDAFRGLAFERTVEAWAQMADVPVPELVKLARLYAETKPAALLVGWGLGRRKNGARTVRCLDALGVLTGNMGISGGGVSFYFGRRNGFDCNFGETLPEPPRTFSEARLGREILEAKDPPVRVAWVTAGNPVSMLPDSSTVKQAFDGIDFTVVVDTHPTDTTDLADVVLPTRTLLEDDDLLGAYGHHWLRVSQPAIEAPPEVLHEVEILKRLASRVGLDNEMAGTIADWKIRALAKVESKGVNLAELEKGTLRNPLAPKVVFEGRRFSTPTGRARLLTEAPEPAPCVDENYPLTLLAVSTPKAQSSQAAYPIPAGPPEVRVHPSASGEIGDGSPAVLESRIGRMQVCVRHDARVRTDVVWMDKGGMLRHRRCANVLVSAIETDHGGGAAYYDEPVRLVPLASFEGPRTQDVQG